MQVAAVRMPGGIFIDARDRIYVADSLSSLRRMRAGSVASASATRETVRFRHSFQMQRRRRTRLPPLKGAVDAQGNIYGAVVPTPGLLSYVRK